MQRIENICQQLNMKNLLILNLITQRLKFKYKYVHLFIKNLNYFFWNLREFKNVLYRYFDMTNHIGELYLILTYNNPDIHELITTADWEDIKIPNFYETEIIGICSLVDRSLSKTDFKYDYKSLLELPIESWNEDDMPDWLKQIPITSPGRSGKKK